MIAYIVVAIGIFLCWEIYFLAKRWGVAIITAILVAGKLSDPLRAKWFQEILDKRQPHLDLEGPEHERKLEELDEQLSKIDPMCANGRQELWEVAWELYKDAGRIKPGDYFKAA